MDIVIYKQCERNAKVLSAVPRCPVGNDQRAFHSGGFTIKAGIVTIRNPHTYLVGALALHRPAEHVTETSQSTAAFRRPESSVICKSLMRLALAQYFFGGVLFGAPHSNSFFLIKFNPTLGHQL